MKKQILGLALALLAGGASFAQTRFVEETAQNRKGLLEEYTGIHCGYCPAGHAIANDLAKKYPDQVFLINVHAGGYAVPQVGEVDLRTPYGDALVSNAGVSGFPSGSINRHVFSGVNTEVAYNTWATQMPKIFAMSSYVNIASKATLDWNTRELKVTVQLYYTADAAVAKNYIHVALTQSNIVGTQANYGNYNPAQILPGGKYVHHHALRDLLTGQWGDTTTNVKEGAFVERVYTTTLPDKIRNIDLELLDLQVVAFVTENRNEVMNACEAEIEHLNGPEHYVKLSDMTQLLDNTCDKAVRFSVQFDPRVATDSIRTITFRYKTGEGVNEFEYTPQTPIAANNKQTIITEPIELPQLNKAQQVSLWVANINGKEYAYIDTLKVEAMKLLGKSKTEAIAINIWQDKYGTDITWKLKDLNSATQLAEGGPYFDLTNTNPVKRSTNVTLAQEGCYAFTIYDKGKDGINNKYGAGYLTFTDAENKIFMRHDGKYKDSLRLLLHYDANAVYETANEKAEEIFPCVLMPNPASDHSVLKMDLPKAQKLDVRILSADGRCVLNLGEQRLSAGLQEIVLPTTALSEGLYLVVVRGKGVQLSKKLVIVR